MKRSRTAQDRARRTRRRKGRRAKARKVRGTQFALGAENERDIELLMDAWGERNRSAVVRRALRQAVVVCREAGQRVAVGSPGRATEALQAEAEAIFGPGVIIT